MKNIFKSVKRISVLVLAILILISVMPTAFVNAASTNGKTYYVAVNGSDTADGLSEDEPMSFYKANATLLKGGDKMLFKRGDVFYGIFTPVVGDTDNDSRVEVGAYGEGDLPILSMAKIVSKSWENAGNGFYKFDLSNDDNYSGIRNKQVADKDIANVGFYETNDGKIYGERKKDAASCQKKYDFYCDETHIYVKTDKDPYADLGELTMAIHGAIIRLNKGVNIRNLHLQHSGYGICWKSSLSIDDAKFCDITDCVIEKLGGTVIDVENFTRAGNGVELYDRGENVLVENNIFRYIFDVAFTCQGSTPGKWRNITVNNNVITYCTQALEFWCGGTGSGDGILNFEFSNNLCVKNGESWASLGGTPRLNSSDILVYGWKAPNWQVKLSNNTFYHSTGENDTIYYVSAQTVDTFLKYVDTDKNYIYHVNENSRVFVTDDTIAKYDKLRYNIKQWLDFSGKDKNSTFTSIEKNLNDYKNLESVAAVSNDFKEIVKAAADSGLTVDAEYKEKQISGNNDKESENNNENENKEDNGPEFTISKRAWLFIAILGGAVLIALVFVSIIIVISIKDKKRMSENNK